jgi:hypothetical protein
MSARKKRKITAAHLRALQAGRKRYQKEQRAKNPKRKRKAGKARNPKWKINAPRATRGLGLPKNWVAKVRPKHRNPPDSERVAWWVFDKGNQHCQYGQGRPEDALKKAKRIANRIGRKVSVWGPYESRMAAYDACN